MSTLFARPEGPIGNYGPRNREEEVIYPWKAQVYSPLQTGWKALAYLREFWTTYWYTELKIKNRRVT
jgi:hypothetical protein